MSDVMSSSDIPSVQDMKTPFMVSLQSGHARSIESITKDVANNLGISASQRKYCAPGDTTPVFQNRVLEAYTDLVWAGLVEIPRRGKVKLTPTGKKALANLANVTPAYAKDLYNAVQTGSQDGQPETAETMIFKQPKEANHVFSHKEGDYANAGIASQVTPKKGRWKRVAASVVCLALAFGLGNVTGINSTESRVSEQAAILAKQQAVGVEAEKAQDSELSFIVKADNVGKEVGTVCVHMVGETDSGEQVDRLYKAKPDTPYVVDYGAGIFSFEIDAGKTSNDKQVFQTSKVKVAYADNRDLTVNLDLELDKKATGAKAEEAKAKTGAEAKKRAEVEAKAAADKKAKAKDEKERQKKAAAVAAATKATKEKENAELSSKKNERTVYITNTGEKYHNGDCRFLSKSKIPVSLSDAEARGYEACKVCGG